jgi:NADH-quinone oxidoreductase subunit C
MKEKLLEKLNSRFRTSIENVNEFRGELTIGIKREDIVNVCRFLRDDEELKVDSLRDICGAERYKSGDRFEVVYNLYSLANKFRFRLKVSVSETLLHVPTVSDVWSAANFAEREAYDMFGIIFDGHPDLRRIYMPEEFEHHPLRKDFPLMGIPGSLSLPRK